MFRVFVSVLLLILGVHSQAQIRQGGEPYNWKEKTTSMFITSFERMPEINLEALQAEDALVDQYKETPYRFGVEQAVSFNQQNSGEFQFIDNGDRIWRIGIICQGASSVNLTFDQFELVPGAQVFIWTSDREDFIGSFTEQNNKEHGSLAVGLLPGDEIVVELIEPKKTIGLNKLSIGEIVHGYRDIMGFSEKLFGNRGPFGNSGACNINVNCAEGIPWEDQIRSVAIIVQGGSGVCSGALVNNVTEDGTPYFLTANHCLGNPNNWIFYFNHESPTCVGNTGPTNQSVSSAVIRASNGNSDFGLLELSTGVPESFDVCYAGWDASDQQNNTGAVAIHHPWGDVKKICFEEDAPYHSIGNGAQVWWIDEWELGVTEPGSSGSPLFNQNGRIIGQLFGGQAACSGNVNNGQFDFFGRFGVSWNGATSSSRLRDWLDPNNTGTTIMDAYCPSDIVVPNDVQAYNITNLPTSGCDSEPFNPNFTLKNNGTENLISADIIYSYNGGGTNSIAWTGNLAEDEFEVIELPLFTPVTGNNTIEVEVDNPNGNTDGNLNNNITSTAFDLIIGLTEITITLETDNWGYEIYWEFRDMNNSVIAFGGNTDVGPNGGGNQTAGQGDPGAYDSFATIVETVQIPDNGCYTFLIVDDYGDGLCCAGIAGSYTVRDINNVILAEGSSFGSQEETQFPMDGASGLSNIHEPLVGIYPNPVKDKLFINLSPTAAITSLNVYDLSGRMVSYSFSNLDGIDVVKFNNRLNAGLYTLEIVADQQRIRRKFVYQP